MTPFARLARALLVLLVVLALTIDVAGSVAADDDEPAAPDATATASADEATGDAQSTDVPAADETPTAEAPPSVPEEPVTTEQPVEPTPSDPAAETTPEPAPPTEKPTEEAPPSATLPAEVDPPTPEPGAAAPPTETIAAPEAEAAPPTPTETAVSAVAEDTVEPAEEPVAIISVLNCVAVFDEEQRAYGDCSVATGVVLSVWQGGGKVGTFTSNVDGVISFELPVRAVFTVRYEGGSSAEWVPGAKEETQRRYGQETSFTFVPAPEIDREWTMTVKGVTHGYIGPGPNSATIPVVGACYEIRDLVGGLLLLGPVCDDDLDGVVTLGKLPPYPGSVLYVAVAVSSPAGFEPRSAWSSGVQPTTVAGEWVAPVEFVPTLRVRTIGPDGELIPGFCYFANHSDGGLATFTICDDADGANDGVVNFNLASVLRLDTLTINPPTHVPRYVVTESKVVSLPTLTDVVFHAVRTGRDDPTKADVLVRIVDQDGERPGNAFNFCLQLDQVAGSFVSSAFCADGQDGLILFEDAPIGRFDFIVSRRPVACEPPSTIPELVIAVDDLGTTVTAPDLVFTCKNNPPPPHDECVVERATTRQVDVYFGRLTDPTTGEEVATSLQLSETIGFTLGRWLQFDPVDPLVTASVADWVDQTGPFADLFWINVEDWQADARQHLLDDFARAGGAIVAGEPTDHGTRRYEVSHWTDFDENVEAYPECDGLDVDFAWVERVGYAEVSFVELNAKRQEQPTTATVALRAVDGAGDGLGDVCFRLSDDLGPYCADPDGDVTMTGVPVGSYSLTLTTTPAGCAAPSPLPEVVVTEDDLGATLTLADVVFTCTPVPDCEPRQEFHVREATAYFGTVAVEADGSRLDIVQLSDHIGPLRSAIVADAVDPRVADGIDDWANDEMGFLEWVLTDPEGLDAEANLRAAFTEVQRAKGGALVIAEPIDRGTSDYLLTTIPRAQEVEGCAEPVIVTDNYIGRFHYVELNATVEPIDDGEEPDPTPPAGDHNAVALPVTGVGHGGQNAPVWPLGFAVIALCVAAKGVRRRAA